MVVFTNFLFSQYSSSTPTPYMNVGLMMNPNGFEMGMYFIPKSENKTLFKFTGGYGWFGGQDGSGSYEDYTETLGTVNTFDDRFDGEFSISNYYFSLSQTPNYSGRYFWYGYAGGSLSTVDSFTIRGGIGISFL